MSFVYDIRNLKDCKDFKSKREDFFRMLRLQAKLNRNYEQATIARHQMEQLGVTPVMQSRRSMEDEQKDLMLQQQLAIKNLKSIMSDDEVRRTVHILADQEIYFLNSEFGRLMPFLQGRQNITSDFFKRVLQRFKLYLDSTGMTGIPIPLRESTIHGMPGDLLDEWQEWAKQTIDPLTGRVADLEELIRRTAETMNRTEEDVAEEVASEEAMDVEQEDPTTDMPGEMPEVPPPRGTKRKPTVSKQNLLTKRPRTVQERVSKRTIEEIITGVEDEMNKRMKGMPDEPFVGMTKPKPKTRKRDDITPTLPEKKPRMDASASLRGVKRKDNQFVETTANKLAATGRLTLDQARSLARSEIDARQQAYVPPVPVPAPQVLGRRARDDDDDATVVIPQQPIARRPRTRRNPVLTLAQARQQARESLQARVDAFVSPQTTTPVLGRRGREDDINIQSNTRARTRLRPVIRPVDDMMVEPEYVPFVNPVVSARQEARQAQAQRAEMRAKEIESGQGLFISPQRTTQEYGPPAVFSRFSHTGGGTTFTKKDRRVITRGGKLLGKSGAGIQANDELKTFDRYKQLGRYMLHVPSLSKSMVNIKYPSMVSIPGIPQKFVSQDFIELLWKLVDEGVFEKPLFNKLDQEEQDYFKFLARKCTFDQTIGFGVGKSQTKEEMEDAKRFELLRGTVVAGNNSPEVLNELRRYILKFLNDKRIPKQQGHDLLYEMTCLGV